MVINVEKFILKDELLKLDKRQLKLFYSVLVHYWLKNKSFISKQNFFNLWCELNELCSEVDEGFPEPHDDHQLLKSFCQAHPFYFIDILDTGLVIKFFCEHLDNKLDILATTANKLRTGDLRAAYECCNEALGMAEDIDKLVVETKAYVSCLS